MIKKPKIIHLLSILPHPIIKNIINPKDGLELGIEEYEVIEKYPYWVGFFKGDHHEVSAKKLKEITDKYVVECWRPYGNKIEKTYSRVIDGILHRVFPAKSLSIPYIGNFIWSKEIFGELKKEIQKGPVLLNIGVGHAWFHIWLLLKLQKIKEKLPVVCIHLSGGFKIFNFQKLDPWKKIFKWYYYIEYWLDVKSLKYVDFYFSGSIIEANYFKNVLHYTNASFFMEGCDFEYFKPSIRKNELRAELKLPQDKKIMIVTGNFKSQDYGYHHLIDCYDEIIKQHNDICLIMVGGYKHEDLYEKGLNVGIIMIERIPKNELLKYFQAADFYGQPSFEQGFIENGGFGFAMVEALACGLPVISNNIIHFPGTLMERAKIGFDMPSNKELIKNILYLKDNFQQYTECREMARKYFDVNNTKYVMVKKYDELLSAYYGIQ